MICINKTDLTLCVYETRWQMWVRYHHFVCATLLLQSPFFLLFSFSGLVLGPYLWLLILGEKIKEEMRGNLIHDVGEILDRKFHFGLRWKPGRSAALQSPRSLQTSTGWHYTHSYSEIKNIYSDSFQICTQKSLKSLTYRHLPKHLLPGTLTGTNEERLMDTVLLIPLWWLLEKQFQSVNQRGSKNLGRALPWALAGRTSWVCEQFVWFSFVPSRPGRAELDSWDLISLEEGFEKTWMLLILERGKSQGADLHHSPPRKICLPLQVLGKQIGEMCCFDEKPGVKIRNKYWKNNIYKVQRTRKRRTRLMCERKKVQSRREWKRKA